MPNVGRFFSLQCELHEAATGSGVQTQAFSVRDSQKKGACLQMTDVSLVDLR